MPSWPSVARANVPPSVPRFGTASMRAPSGMRMRAASSQSSAEAQSAFTVSNFAVRRAVSSSTSLAAGATRTVACSPIVTPGPNSAVPFRTSNTPARARGLRKRRVPFPSLTRPLVKGESAGWRPGQIIASTSNVAPARTSKVVSKGAPVAALLCPAWQARASRRAGRPSFDGSTVTVPLRPNPFQGVPPSRGTWSPVNCP